MAAPVDVINSALQRIGATRISSPDDDNKNANVSRLVYGDILEDLLRSHFWNFATRRVELVQLTAVPTFEYDYAYALPSDWLRTVSAHPNGDGYQAVISYKEELLEDQRVILANYEQVFLRYIALVTDVNLWAADFKQAMILSLARDLAMPLANSNSLHEKYVTLTKNKLAQARSSDAMGSSPERRPRGSWTTRRGTVRPRVGEPSN